MKAPKIARVTLCAVLTEGHVEVHLFGRPAREDERIAEAPSLEVPGAKFRRGKAHLAPMKSQEEIAETTPPGSRRKIMITP